MMKKLYKNVQNISFIAGAPSDFRMVILVEPPNKFVNNMYGTNFMNRRKSMIMCANCGGLGHVYRTCNHPTISYGVICYKFYEGKPYFLMVQRKDSLSYVEFIRGKYDLQNKNYLMKLFSFMTEEERQRMNNGDFEDLWRDMWCKNEDNTKHYNKEYGEAIEKFNKLKRGYYIKSQDDRITFINIQYLINNTMSLYEDTEWGFPKGRRNVNENDINCAIREFKEETGMSALSLRMIFDMKPLEEVFSGTNKKRYKHVYYVAQLAISDPIQFEARTPACREVKAVKWFSYEEAQGNIRDINIERKELLKRLNHIVTKA